MLLEELLMGGPDPEELFSRRTFSSTKASSKLFIVAETKGSFVRSFGIFYKFSDLSLEKYIFLVL